MKKIKIKFLALLFSLIIINGCVVLDKYSVSTNAIDLTKFEQQGIFVTTGDFTKDYKSISILRVECFNGYKAKTNSRIAEKEKEKMRRSDDIYPSSEFDKKGDYEYKTCDLDELFQEIIRQAKDSGANGIIRLEIQKISRNGINSKIAQTGIEIVGLAIKIK